MAASIQRRPASWSRGLAGVLGAALVFCQPAIPAAHDIPASVVVQAFARPEGQRFRLLLRVPLVSMRDVAFPKRPGLLDSPMLDVSQLEPMLQDAARLWLIPAVAVFEEDTRLDPPVVASARIALPIDRSFDDYERAVAHFASPPLAAGTRLPVTSALLDVMLEYRIGSDRSRFSLDPQFGRLGLRVVTTLRFRLSDKPERAFQFTGDPGLVRLDPRWHQAARRFIGLGFAHILDGIDHLLFLFCLVLPIRRIWHLVGVVTAFTAAHSITLSCAAFGYAPSALWFPPLVETLIAVSIVYMALENIIGSIGSAASATSGRFRSRWVVAFGFGLVHGFGFSFALQGTLQFAGSHLMTSLVSFNVGVELGQLLVLAILVPALSFAFRYVVGERVGVIIASALVAHTAWHWMTERGATLGEYDWSIGGAAGLATLLRWLMAGVTLVGVVWLIRTLRASRRSTLPSNRSIDR